MNLAKLRGALAEKGITQRELAKKLGLTTKSVNAKLNGRCKISVDEAASMSKILKLKEQFFLIDLLHKCNKRKGE